MTDSKRVIPLESNPAIFTEMAHRLGLSPVLEFHDVLSLTEPDLVAFLPQPVLGITLLFPITEQYESYRLKSDQSRLNGGLDATWFKQTIGNGCGLYALLHLLANIPRDLIIENLVINKFLLSQLTPTSSEDEIIKLVEGLESQIQLDEKYGSKGQTEAPAPEEKVELHFISFVKGRDGHLYELDGRRTGPVDLGECNTENLLEETKINDKIQFYMANTSEEHQYNFAMIALGPALD